MKIKEKIDGKNHGYFKVELKKQGRAVTCCRFCKGFSEEKREYVNSEARRSINDDMFKIHVE